jgi:ligand-binding sensor domain-containing protein
VRAIHEDTAGRLWVGTDGGLDLLDRQQATFAHYRHDPTDPRASGEDNVMSLFQDKGGVLWVGTRSAGVHRWNPATWSFGHHTRSASGASGLTDKTVTSFAEDRVGRIWIGTFGGLHVMDRQTGTVTKYTPASGTPGDRVMALATDPEGMLWIGTMGAGLSRLDPATGVLRSYRHAAADPRSLAADAVMALMIDGLGDLWVGTYGGGLRPLRRRHRHLRALQARRGRRPDDPGRHRDVDGAGPSGGIWLGTDGGRARTPRPPHRQGAAFQPRSRGRGQLGSNTVYTLYLDTSNRLWIGTRGSGLALLESRTGTTARFRHHRQKDGLANDVVYGVLPDGEGHLWLSTNNGLSRFDPQTSAFRNYDASQRAAVLRVQLRRHLRSASGELFFGGVNGFNAFHPRRLAVTRERPAGGADRVPQGKPRGPDGRAAVAAHGHRPRLPRRRGDLRVRGAGLRARRPQPLRLQAGGLRPRLGGPRQRASRHLHGPRPWPTTACACAPPTTTACGTRPGLVVPVHVEAPPWLRWWAFVAYALVLGARPVGVRAGAAAQGGARGAVRAAPSSRTCRAAPTSWAARNQDLGAAQPEAGGGEPHRLAHRPAQPPLPLRARVEGRRTSCAAATSRRSRATRRARSTCRS